MITQVPMAWESVSWDGSLTGIKFAIKWLLSVSVHGMGLALVSEETGGGGKTGIGACGHLTAVWLKVRVDAFAEECVSYGSYDEETAKAYS